MRVSTSILNELMADAQLTNPPPTKGGRPLKIYYLTQASVAPPTFVLFVNDPALLHFSYKRYIENRLRETFGFEGTPVRIITRGKKERMNSVSFLLLLVAYVIGSVPSGLIVGRVFFNTDLRDYGSKNIGATNAYRVLGAPAGLCVLIADVGKGSGRISRSNDRKYL